MRIPIPERIRPSYAVALTLTLVVVQLFERTEPSYAALTAAYCLLFAAAFNQAKGLIYPSGNWIFFNGLLGTLFAIVFKAILGEPGHTNLQDPIGTLLVECCAMFTFAIVAALNRKLASKKSLLPQSLQGETMRKAAVGSLILGVVIAVFCWPKPNDEGTLASALRQINHFNEMAILLATFYQVKKTGGRESSNWIVWTSGLCLFFAGLLSMGKQGMIAGPFTWVLAAAVAGHNFSRKQILSVIVGLVLFQQFLVPYSQVSRNYKSDTFNVKDDFNTALTYLTQLGDTRAEYQDDLNSADESGRETPTVYDQPEGFFDRLCMLQPDDELIAFTNRGNVYGLMPIVYDAANVIPHFLWRDKPLVKVGNVYYHEMGHLGDMDDTTGISFSPEADAYHEAKWFGVFLVLPPLLLGLFLLMDSTTGDVRQAPWGILYVVTVAHQAPEGSINGLLYTATFLTETIIVVSLVSKYILPIFGGVITNTERTRVRKTRDFAPIAVGSGPRLLREDEPYPDIP